MRTGRPVSWKVIKIFLEKKDFVNWYRNNTDNILMLATLGKVVLEMRLFAITKNSLRLAERPSGAEYYEGVVGRFRVNH